jgi:hypothetical protein
VMGEETMQALASKHSNEFYDRTYLKVFTSGGLRYSIPTLRALREVLRTSFIKLYLSIRKLSVGPSDSFTILSDGATEVSVKARIWEICRAGPSVR